MNWQEISTAVEAAVVKLIHKTEARGCLLINTGTQSLSSGSVIALSFSGGGYDTDGCWAAGSPAKLTAQRDGYYLAGGGWGHLTGTTSVYRMGIYLIHNTAAGAQKTLATHMILTGANTYLYVTAATGMFWMSAGDFLYVCGYQDSGGAKTVLAAAATSYAECYGWLMRVG